MPPVAALIFCPIDRVDYSVIHGKTVLSPDGLLTLDGTDLLHRHQALAQQLAD